LGTKPKAIAPPEFWQSQQRAVTIKPANGQVWAVQPPSKPLTITNCAPESAPNFAG